MPPHRVSRPGSTGTDWRVHLGYNLSALAIDSVELTDFRGGETLTRFRFQPGELVLGDRGYAHRAGLHAVRHAGADFIVRMGWQNLPLADSETAASISSLPCAACRKPNLAVLSSCCPVRAPQLPLCRCAWWRCGRVKPPPNKPAKSSCGTAAKGVVSPTRAPWRRARLHLPADLRSGHPVGR